MPVFRHAVRPQAFVALGIEKRNVRLASGTAYATLAVGNDASGLDEPSAQQRYNRQQDAGGVTARSGDEFRVSDGGTMQLGHAVDGLFQQSRRGMWIAVKLLVHSCIIEPEICGEIDDRASGLNQWLGKFSGHTMGQGEENHLRSFGQCRGIRLSEFERGTVAEARENFGQRLSRVLARGNGGEFHVRVSQEQSHEFLAGIAGRADHGGL